MHSNPIRNAFAQIINNNISHTGNTSIIGNKRKNEYHYLLTL